MSNDAKSMLDRRKELLRRRMIESGVVEPVSARTAAPRARVGERYPLSAGQRRMWFIQTHDREDTTLNICVAYRLTGALDTDRLRAAVTSVVDRHHILRTTYGLDADGEPYQVVHAELAPSWQVHDLADLPEVDRSRRLEVLARREFNRPFDLAEQSPLRITVVRTGAEEFALVLVVHHIAWDDDSWSVFFAELAAAYDDSAPSSELAAQYIDAEVLDAAARDESGIDFWRGALRPLPEPLELPGTASGAAAAGRKQAEISTKALPADLLGRVEEFARARGATPFMVLLAAYGAVVHRYTTATDFLISVPVTVRRNAAAEALIGYFGNALLLRLSPRMGDSFAELTAAARETSAAAFANQHVGIDQVVREANPDRVNGRDGLEQLVRLGFAVRKSAAGFGVRGVTASQLTFGSQVAQLPLTLSVVLEPEGARLEAEYRVGDMDAALVEQLLDHYVQLLDSALADPDRGIGHIDMLGAHRARIMELSHGDLVEEPATTLVALFEKQVAAEPDSIAVVAPSDTGGAGVEMTYDALNRRANRLAHWLIARGIGTEDIVGLRIANSAEFIVALLGVQKAGAAYLPIDPAYPDDRIDYLVEDAAPRLVFGTEELAEAESAAANLPDHDPADTERLRPLRPDNLSYVIYTSGSTGKPKGVPVPHSAIAEHLVGFTTQWGMTAEDRLLQSSSVSFDASLLDIFVTLTLGARLVVPKPDAFRDVAYVADLITRCGVTVLHMVPSMLSTFLLLPEVSEWRALRHVPVGGEALPGEIADKFARIFDAELRNHYGPTEAVVCSTHMAVRGPQGTGIVPIGIPNQNVDLYLLDTALQPVPTGVVGEIYLGGEQLARGYLNRRGLSAERFVADPFADGQRLYRTGDLARRNVRGEIEFVGRADEQVKVRGFRIELGEVEAAIASHPSVGHCVVIAVADKAVGAMLAAYVVPAGDADSVDFTDIRAHASAALPEYMVPSAFAVIAEIPLTVHGKLDRRALPAPNPVSARGFREPATATERRMCAIFAALFGLDAVGVDDSFFELGGHSLLAARLVAQIRAEFGIELDVRVPFDTPTSAGLAQLLVTRFRDEFDIDLDSIDFEDEAEPAQAEAAPSATPEPVRRDRPDRVPLSYSQRALWFQDRMEGTSAAGNIPFAVRFDGPLDRTALRTALGDVVARHEALRTTFPVFDGAPSQSVGPVAEVDLPVTEIAEDELDAALAEIARYCFTVDSEPLLRAQLFAVGGNHVLSLLIHHLVSDHGSLQVLLADLITAYRARLDGAAPVWTPLPIQYADYALWQQDLFDSDSSGTPSSHGRALIDFWRTALDGLPDEIAVAHDRPRPTMLSKRGEVVTFTLPADRRAALKALAETAGASEFMVYQAAVATLLSALGGGADIAIGSPVAGRTDATAGLVGLFANMAVVRNDLSGDPTLRATVTRTRDRALDAYVHQGLPIERLVEAINPARSMSRNPLFQTMVHFRGADWAPEPLAVTGDGATTATALPVDFDFSFLDLNLNYAVRSDGGLDVRLVASADLYDSATAHRIGDALRATLDAYATAPDTTVAELRPLPEAQLRELRERRPSARVEAEAGTAATGGPATETARILIAILEELLEITDVTPEDGFFALGGDSVVSIQWATRAVEANLPLEPKMVFENHTIAALAAAVDAAMLEPVEEAPRAREPESAPMSASGLDSDALAALSASWQARA
ncbi:non-ribosomal peptide synthetase [Nocardia bovistercoris]|uniref:Amino acid adenylation domain-containing protein n=1 Tax=Nocardia bovistercoris TaxID=2785916 RepID=A0A931IBY7_9NOCA|nr:non-ribosomal peptide synthetase [Nocardia bovistercoris]MBH0777630.1 amino acid adenylation domain-containing protein [Nocardia bovistercoris]